MVSIARHTVNMRSGPSKRYGIVWELGRGYPLKVLKSKGNWYKVIDFENDTGWVYKKMVSRSPHLIVKKQQINIRIGPGEKFKIIGKAKYGVVFKTLEQKSNWVKVRHENGLTGWVFRSLLWGF